MGRAEQENEARRKAGVDAAIREQERLTALPINQHTVSTIDALNSDEYKKLLRNPEFVEHVNLLESQRKPRPVK